MTADASSIGTHPGGTVVRQAWSRVLWRGAAATFLCLLVTVNVPLRADTRFNVFRFGGDLAQRPWELVTGPIASVPSFLATGNFRPLARMVERSQDSLAFSLSRTLELPVPIGSRVVDLLFAAGLAVVVVLWVETLTSRTPVLDRPPSAAAHVATLCLPILLVLTPDSAVERFGALYHTSAAVVLLVSLAATRLSLLRRTRLGPAGLLVALVVGAALACFNEVGYLALPAAAVGVAARGLGTLRLSPRELLRSAATRWLAAASVGLLLVLVPVRAIIARNCSDGSCYVASDIADPAQLPGTLLHRLLSALPGAGWLSVQQTTVAARSNLSELVTLPMLLLYAVLLLLTVRTLGDVARADRPTGAAVLGLGLTGATLVLATSVAMSMSAYLQRLTAGDWPIGSGWRDQPLVAAAVTALLVAAGLGLLGSGRRPSARRWLPAAVVGALALGMLTTTAVNRLAVAEYRPHADALVIDRLSLALVNFEEVPEAERCALLDDFAEVHLDNTSWQRRMRVAMDSAAQAWAGQSFCSQGGMR